MINFPRIKFYGNSFSRIYAATRGEQDRRTERQAVVTEGIGAPCDYVDAPKLVRESKHNPLKFLKCF
jgi:hypothetical protein